MANELHQKAAPGPYTPRKRSALHPAEFNALLIPYYKQNGTSSLELARLLRNS